MWKGKFVSAVNETVSQSYRQGSNIGFVCLAQHHGPTYPVVVGSDIQVHASGQKQMTQSTSYRRGRAKSQSPTCPFKNTKNFRQSKRMSSDHSLVSNQFFLASREEIRFPASVFRIQGSCRHLVGWAGNWQASKLVPKSACWYGESLAKERSPWWEQRHSFQRPRPLKMPSALH